jgi:hypothetical protein
LPPSSPAAEQVREGVDDSTPQPKNETSSKHTAARSDW